MQQATVTLVGPLTWRGTSSQSELQLGLLSLAAVLKPSGITPDIVDLNLLDRNPMDGSGGAEEAVSRILDTVPDVVGFGSICSSYPLTLRLAAEVKRARPGVTVVLGGPQASVVDASSMLAFPAVDFVVRGEAERSFPALLAALAGGKPLSRIGGVTYRRDRRIARNPNAPVIQDLDELPLPLYDYYPGLERGGSLPLEAGRGCPFACRFCSTNDFFRRKYRLKSATRLVSEMVLLAGRYGVREFQLTHDMFTVDRRRVAQFCETLLEQEVRLRWRCSARTDCVDPELLALMARAGCSGIFFGIETGSQRLQHVVDKNLDLGAARSILQAADGLGIHTTASLITGYPSETSEDLDGTAHFFGEAIRLENCDPQLHLLSPLAETPLATEYREQLVYDGIASDISGDRAGLHALDELLVLAHPDIFPNFYALPCPISRAYLQHLRAFLLAVSARAKGLAVALHTECGGLRAVFDAWQAACRVPTVVEGYASWEFFQDFLEFLEARYLGTGRIAVEVLVRFYAALEREARRAVDDASPGIRVAANFRIVRVEGDVVAVLAALRKSEPPDPSCLVGTRTLAVEVAEDRNTRILELSRLAASILWHCRRPILLNALESRLAGSGVAGRVKEAVGILERQGLLEVTKERVSAVCCGS